MMLSEEGVIILYTPNDDGTKAELNREVTSEVSQLEKTITDLHAILYKGRGIPHIRLQRAKDYLEKHYYQKGP